MCVMAKGSKVLEVGNTNTDRGRLCIMVYFCTPPEVECSGIVQMFLPDVDQTVTSD